MLQPTTQSASYTHGSWLINAVSQIGTPSYKRAKANDDAFLISGNTQAYWLLIADGISTSAHGGYAARTAVDTADQTLRQITQITEHSLTTAFAAAHDRITTLAARTGQIADYGTTLAGVIITTAGSIHAANIGDSSIASLARNGRDIAPLCSAPIPPSNGVHTISHPQWRRHLATRTVPDWSLSAVILATDGANDFIDAPHQAAPPIVALLADLPSWEEKAPAFHFNAFLDHPQSGDDRTLITALNTVPHSIPHAARR